MQISDINDKATIQKLQSKIKSENKEKQNSNRWHSNEHIDTSIDPTQQVQEFLHFR